MVMPPSPQSSPECFCHPQGNQHPLAVTLYPTPPWTLETTSVLSVPLDWPVLDPSCKRNLTEGGLPCLASFVKHDVVKVLPCGSMDQCFSLTSGGTNVHCKDDTPPCCSDFSRTCLQIDCTAGWPPLARADQTRPHSSLSLFVRQDAGLYGLPFPLALSSGFLWDATDGSHWQDTTQEQEKLTGLFFLPANWPWWAPASGPLLQASLARFFCALSLVILPGLQEVTASCCWKLSSHTLSFLSFPQTFSRLCK